MMILLLPILLDADGGQGAIIITYLYKRTKIKSLVSFFFPVRNNGDQYGSFMLLILMKKKIKESINASIETIKSNPFGKIMCRKINFSKNLGRN